MIRVVLADDQALVRGGFRMILEAQPDIEVIGEADNGLRAVQQCRELAADVVLMDIRMPTMNGIDAAAEIARRLLEQFVARPKPGDRVPEALGGWCLSRG
ncbi:MAG: response regulator transcription factor [Euzebya sp.]